MERESGEHKKCGFVQSIGKSGSIATKMSLHFVGESSSLWSEADEEEKIRNELKMPYLSFSKKL